MTLWDVTKHEKLFPPNNERRTVFSNSHKGKNGMLRNDPLEEKVGFMSPWSSERWIPFSQGA